MRHIFIKVTIRRFEIIISQLALAILNNILIRAYLLIIWPYFLKLLVADVFQLNVLTSNIITFALNIVLFRLFVFLLDLVDDFVKVNLIQSRKLGLWDIFRIKINFTILFYLFHLKIIQNLKIWLELL